MMKILKGVEIYSDTFLVTQCAGMLVLNLMSI